MGDNPGFYNAPSRKSKSQKLLVGSFNVNPQQKAAPHPGIGNQVRVCRAQGRRVQEGEGEGWWYGMVRFSLVRQVRAVGHAPVRELL